MTTYADIQAGFRKDTHGVTAPSKTLLVQPGEFADEWVKKPKSEILIGLRLLPSDEDQAAAKQAAKDAVAEHPNDPEAQVKEYISSIQAWCVARSICDPNDVNKPHPLILRAEDTIRMALTSVAITRLFDEVERHHIDSSPLYDEATDEQLDLLGQILVAPDPFAGMSDAKADRCRRYANFILNEIIDTDAQAEESSE